MPVEDNLYEDKAKEIARKNGQKPSSNNPERAKSTKNLKQNRVTMVFHSYGGLALEYEQKETQEL